MMNDLKDQILAKLEEKFNALNHNILTKLKGQLKS